MISTLVSTLKPGPLKVILHFELYHIILWSLKLWWLKRLRKNSCYWKNGQLWSLNRIIYFLGLSIGLLTIKGYYSSMRSCIFWPFLFIALVSNILTSITINEKTILPKNFFLFLFFDKIAKMVETLGLLLYNGEFSQFKKKTFNHHIWRHFVYKIGLLSSKLILRHKLEWYCTQELQVKFKANLGHVEGEFSGSFFFAEFEPIFLSLSFLSWLKNCSFFPLKNELQSNPMGSSIFVRHIMITVKVYVSWPIGNTQFYKFRSSWPLIIPCSLKPSLTEPSSLKVCFARAGIK